MIHLEVKPHAADRKDFAEASHEAIPIGCPTIRCEPGWVCSEREVRAAQEAGLTPPLPRVCMPRVPHCPSCSLAGNGSALCRRTAHQGRAAEAAEARSRPAPELGAQVVAGGHLQAPWARCGQRHSNRAARFQARQKRGSHAALAARAQSGGRRRRPGVVLVTANSSD